MNAEKFVQLVSEMMTAQADYWKTRTQSALIKSKDMEKMVRKALADGISFSVEDAKGETGGPLGEGTQIGLFVEDGNEG